jgi:hypothetical protein
MCVVQVYFRAEWKFRKIGDEVIAAGAALEFGHFSFGEGRTNAGFCGQRSYGNRISRAAERRHLRSPTRERWESSFVLKTFKPRSGDISMHKTALFTGIGEKNVAAPRLIMFLGRPRSQRSRIGLRRCRRSAALRLVQLAMKPQVRSHPLVPKSTSPFRAICRRSAACHSFAIESWSQC